MKKIEFLRQVEIFFEIFPYLQPRYSTPQTNSVYQLAVEIAQNHDISTTDLYYNYKDISYSELIAKEGDNIHPNERGHRIAAESIY